jgi:hypothetical protein
MKIKFLILSLVAILFALNVSAQAAKKKPAPKKKHEIWDRQVINKNGTDSRFGKRHRKTYYKPGQELRGDK